MRTTDHERYRRIAEAYALGHFTTEQIAEHVKLKRRRVQIASSEKQRTLTVRVSGDMYDGLSDVSHLTGASMNQLAIEGIQRVLDDPKRRRVREIADQARAEYADVLEQLADS